MGFVRFVGGKLAAVGIGIASLFFGIVFIGMSFVRPEYGIMVFVGIGTIILGIVSAVYFSHKADRAV